MFDFFRVKAGIRRGALVLMLVCSLSMSALAVRPNVVPMAKNLRATINGASTLITIEGTAPMPYSISKPDTRTVLVRLPGVDTSRLEQIYNVNSPLVAGVRVERVLRLGETPVPVVRVLLREPARDRSQLASNNLMLELVPESKTADNSVYGPQATTSTNGLSAANNSPILADDAPGAVPTPTPVVMRPLPTPTSQVRVTPAGGAGQQNSQGQQYGQPGFVGEPINLNVVNADIRDILNYITEQYGVNFVIDSSVSAVPVTVNVTDVPWNFALDAILRANRLGIDVEGNILRVATNEVLASEAAVQERIREAQLNNAPLVTEFIRLNYARASGTLAQAAGSTGGFSGGSTNDSFSGGAGGDATGGGGDQGILPIIARRLSKRGGVEVDGRSNTLIITDVKENIDAIRQLVTLLDQPEPQVEIETRIVIANRNFSRDLGVQLAAVVQNGAGDAVGSFKTLPGATGGGLQPGGIPGGVGGTVQPATGGATLGANLANTVIGLTTGIFGTAQITAAITAAESKGQAKIVATPRVTALNNRPAQIESGQQIPVITPQTGAGGSGGALVFTTTFVSVPLRLSVTPQISDAGTVVLRVTAENNSINTTIAVAGTPGIDTQRMQTEVLVPDGGTTVIGGVLADNETELQNRTPGLGSIPILGNLFKRKLTTRQTNEILFFITPRIYRPDYAGRPTSGTVSTGTRTATIPQPVPLGNPPSNTPTPTQLQQQPAVQPQTNLPQPGNLPAAQPQTATPARPTAATGQRP
ncbi:MAG: type IV pilus secretin PilQ [Pyrinomonadaceae bacterium]|nr:type IV pilus secretin PilQ [Pyrinomonadaceae bacterium]